MSYKFMGSVLSLYPNQMLGDIYLSFAWTTEGELLRVATICITHGLSVAVVLAGICPEAGTMPDHWAIHNPGLGSISVTDHGPQHMHLLGAAALLPNLPPVQPTALHWVNGVRVTTKPMPWHHRVTVEHATPGQVLYYHQHARRKKATEEPLILPQVKGKSKPFRRMMLTTQVQMSRRVQQ